MKLKIEIDLDVRCFQVDDAEDDRASGQEVARILHAFAVQIDTRRLDKGDRYSLMNVDCRTVGGAEVE